MNIYNNFFEHAYKIELKFENFNAVSFHNMAYSKEAMESAIEEVKVGASSILGAARKYGISSNTLHDHLSEKQTKVSTGGQTVLTYTEEREIVHSLIVLGEMGFGLTKDLVDIIVKDYLMENKLPNPFSHGIPGKDRWTRFRKRWPCISKRKPQHLSKKRADASHPSMIDAWFDNLESLFQKIALDPATSSQQNRIWNCDETGLCISVSLKQQIDLHL